MKARINYKSRQIIIIMSIAVVLLIAAITGTVAFVKGNRNVAAAMKNENRQTVENSEDNSRTNINIADNGNLNNNETGNNSDNGKVLPNTGDNANPIDIEQNGNNGENNGATIENDGTKVADTGNTPSTTTENGSVAGNSSSNNSLGNSTSGNQNGNTSTSTTTGEANVPNQEYTQTTVIPGRENVLVEQNTEIGWSPISIVAYSAVSNLKVHKPELELQKLAYLDGDDLEKEPVNTLAQKGETITYLIKILNTGNEDAKNIHTIDTIPDGTELISISAGGTLNDSGKIEWKNDIKAGKTVIVSFKVKVTANSVNLVENIAKVNGDETPETKTPIITTKKTAKVVTTIDKEEILEERDAKVGEKIRYTITIKNTSEVDGTTVITDSIPDGTTLVDGTISKDGKLENNKITWENVKVSANSEEKVSFDVIVNAKNTAGEDVKSVKNTATVGNTPTDEVETNVANINTIKTSEGKHKDGTPVTKENPLHELDTITYTLAVKNIGNGKGIVKISDTVPEGTTLVADSIKCGENTYTEAELNAGIEVSLEGGEEKYITFTVTINPFKDEKITVRNAEAKQDETPVPPTDDEVVKEYVSIDVEKKFEDKENVDKYRPTEITVGLYLSKDATESIKTIKLDNSNNWKASFTRLNKYDLETKAIIDYDVREINLDKNYNVGYEYLKEKNKVTFSITNTLKYENVITHVTAKKIWDDNDGKVGVRTSVTFELYKDGKPTGITQIASDAEDVNWTVTFQNLQKYDVDGREIEYTVVEITQLSNYDEPIYGKEGNILTVKNKIDYTTFTKDVTVTKIWVDPVDAEHKDITINLYQSGKDEIFRTAILEKGKTSYTFTELPKYDSEGNEYIYTAQEGELAGYAPSYSDDKLTITNTINQDETVSVEGIKKWIDPEETTHPTITINLYQNDNTTPFRTTTLKDGETNYKFENLPKYRTNSEGKYELDANGNVQLNKYTVMEEAVDGYNTTYSEDHKTEIINTIAQNNEVSISGTKIWKDPEGTKHPDITIVLLRDGKPTEETVTLKDGEATYSFTGLEKYDLSDGHEYEYTVSENPVEGYKTTYSKDHKSQIANTINQVKKEISGKKTWKDPHGTERPEVTIELYRNKELYRKTKLENDSYKFTDLETYDSEGNEYNYEVKEVEVPGYTSERADNGVDFTNTIMQKETSISGTKTWVDPKDTKHQDITIILLRDGKPTGDEVILKDGTTTYSFTGLEKYDLSDGHEYEYSVKEIEVPGYISKLNGTNFVNTIIEDNKAEVKGTKTWIVPDGIDYPTIKIYLVKNGEKTEEYVELKNGDTSYSFKNLPKYQVDKDGNYILDDKGNVELNEYTVEEVSIDGYTSTQNGFDFVNTINQELIFINGEKTWVDPEGTELVHPEITINLLKNGIKDKTIKLTNGNTKYTFTELPKYQVDEDGRYILDNNGNIQLNQYRVEEEVVQNYETSYDGYNITNTFKQDIQGTVEITTTKTSETSVKTPLDVVFVLDVSGSMNDNDKDKTMVDSVNSAISTIMQENPDSRVGVVAYSSKENSSYSNNSNAITLLPLGKYTPKSDGKYLTIKDDTYTITWRDEWGIPQSATYDKDIISTNVNEVASISLNVYGGTYTQAGIKAGADILTSASTKYTTKVNGKDKEVTRTPVIILLSDGDPTYYNKNYQSLTGDRSGTGNSTSENDAYYTIRTADYYKKQVTSHYYGTTETKSKFYTIGLNMSGTLSKTILDPSSTNVNLCNSEGTDGTGWNKTRNVKGKLYDKIISDGSADKYSYADKSYVGSMTASDLQGIFNTIINDSTTSTDTRDITLEESNKRRVNLEGINTSKEFSLTIGSTSYNFAQAKANGYVKGNDTDGYYVDLSKVAKGSTITISYNK